jgi:hypothetical protein
MNTHRKPNTASRAVGSTRMRGHHNRHPCSGHAPGHHPTAEIAEGKCGS